MSLVVPIIEILVGCNSISSGATGRLSLPPLLGWTFPSPRALAGRVEEEGKQSPPMVEKATLWSLVSMYAGQLRCLDFRSCDGRGEGSVWLPFSNLCTLDVMVRSKLSSHV